MYVVISLKKLNHLIYFFFDILFIYLNRLSNQNLLDIIALAFQLFLCTVCQLFLCIVCQLFLCIVLSIISMKSFQLFLSRVFQISLSRVLEVIPSFTSNYYSIWFCSKLLKFSSIISTIYFLGTLFFKSLYNY